MPSYYSFTLIVCVVVVLQVLQVRVLLTNVNDHNDPYVLYVDAAPRTIKSATLDRAQGSPKLGVGYSATTNAFYSSCLEYDTYESIDDNGDDNGDDGDANIVSPHAYNHECELVS